MSYFNPPIRTQQDKSKKVSHMFFTPKMLNKSIMVTTVFFWCVLKLTARKEQNGHSWMSRKMSKKDPPEGNGFGASAPYNSYKITNITI